MDGHTILIFPKGVAYSSMSDEDFDTVSGTATVVGISLKDYCAWAFLWSTVSISTEGTKTGEPDFSYDEVFERDVSPQLDLPDFTPWTSPGVPPLSVYFNSADGAPATITSGGGGRMLHVYPFIHRDEAYLAVSHLLRSPPPDGGGTYVDTDYDGGSVYTANVSVAGEIVTIEASRTYGDPGYETVISSTTTIEITSKFQQ